MSLTAAQRTLLDELASAAQDALGPASAVGMSAHGGGAAPDGATAGFMQGWYDRLRVDKTADVWDLRSYYAEVRSFTIDAGNAEPWDRWVSADDLAAANLPLGWQERAARDLGAGVMVPAPVKYVTDAVTAAAGVPKKVYQGIRDGTGWKPVGDYLGSLLGWLKWIAVGLAAGVLLFVAYKIARLFK